MLFHIVEDSHVILRSKGVWKQAELYQRDQELYAKYGSGFIGLRASGGTTLPSVSWEAIDTKRSWFRATLGRLQLVPVQETTDDSDQQSIVDSPSPDRGNAQGKDLSQRSESRPKRSRVRHPTKAGGEVQT